MKRLALALSVFVAATPPQALAWGNTGHRLIGQAAARSFPNTLPAFLRSPEGVLEIGELSREPDRSKGAGRVHDKDRDAAHFIDLDDEGRLLDHTTHLNQAPELRVQYETLLAKAGAEPLDGGYLPYASIDAWQQLVLDFAYWRVIVAGETRAKDSKEKAWYAADRKRREALILRDLGVLSHYVGDATNPLHTTIHYNGWGDYPNPQGFTTKPIHSPVEGAFVLRNVTLDEVLARVPASKPCAEPIDRCIRSEILESNGKVGALYTLEKQGAFVGSDSRGEAFVVDRLALAAGRLRDHVVNAWAAAGQSKVGWRPVAVAEVEAGKVDPFSALYGID